MRATPREPCTTTTRSRWAGARVDDRGARPTVADSGCLSGWMRIARERYARLTSAWDDESWSLSRLKIVCLGPALVLNAGRPLPFKMQCIRRATIISLRFQRPVSARRSSARTALPIGA